MSLLDLQCDLVATLRFPAARAPAAPAVLAGADAAERLDIYRGSIAFTLGKALGLAYPTVQRLVGHDFFAWAAALFAEDNAPASADLNRYGQQFPQFLAALPACAGLAYLPDVARLDWAVTHALHADDAAAVRPEALGEVIARADDLSFQPHPSVSLLTCRWPVDEIWRAVLGDDTAALQALDLASGPCFLLVERAGLHVAVLRLQQDEWQFARDLFTGKALAQALADRRPAPLPPRGSPDTCPRGASPDFTSSTTTRTPHERTDPDASRQAGTSPLLRARPALARRRRDGVLGIRQ